MIWPVSDEVEAKPIYPLLVEGIESRHGFSTLGFLRTYGLFGNYKKKTHKWVCAWGWSEN